MLGRPAPRREERKRSEKRFQELVPPETWQKICREQNKLRKPTVLQKNCSMATYLPVQSNGQFILGSWLLADGAIRLPSGIIQRERRGVPERTL